MIIQCSCNQILTDPICVSLTLKCLWKNQRIKNSKDTPKEEDDRIFTLPNSKSPYKAKIIKTVEF